MNYCILNADSIIENIITCEDDETAALFGALPSYDSADIGTKYAPPTPPDPEPTVEERVATLESTKAEKTDLDAIAAAIERGLSL